jgi:hypothetical protein
MIDLQIGTIFHYNDVKLEVTKTKDHICFGCYFEGNETNICCEIACQDDWRRDKTEIIFKEV